MQVKEGLMRRWGLRWVQSLAGLREGKEVILREGATLGLHKLVLGNSEESGWSGGFAERNRKKQ